MPSCRFKFGDRDRNTNVKLSELRTSQEEELEHTFQVIQQGPTARHCCSPACLAPEIPQMNPLGESSRNPASEQTTDKLRMCWVHIRVVLAVKISLGTRGMQGLARFLTLVPVC